MMPQTILSRSTLEANMKLALTDLKKCFFPNRNDVKRRNDNSLDSTYICHNILRIKMDMRVIQLALATSTSSHFDQVPDV